MRAVARRVTLPYEVFAVPGCADDAAAHLVGDRPRRQWKAQVPYLARHFRVVTVEGRGNGAADRPRDRRRLRRPGVRRRTRGRPRRHRRRTGRWWSGSRWAARHALQLAAWHPERAAGVVAIGTALPWPPPPGFDESATPVRGVGEGQPALLAGGLPGLGRVLHVAGVHRAALDQAARGRRRLGPGDRRETLLSTRCRASPSRPRRDAEAICRAVRCPVLVVHGDADAIVPYADAASRFPRWTGGSLVTIPGGGHAPTMRDPVRINLLIRDFVRVARGPRPGRDSGSRPARGTAHGRCSSARRSASGTRAATSPSRTSFAALRPDLEIDWLAQHPVTTVLRTRRPGPPGVRGAGQRVRAHRVGGGRARPARLPGDPADGRDPARELHVFHDVVDAEHYDLVGRRRGLGHRPLPAREPGAQAAPFAWLTDFVGWLPMPDGGRPRRRSPPTTTPRWSSTRPLPAAARPVGLRRRARTTS